jgi:hypothetical protein
VLFPQEREHILDTAQVKLTNGGKFDPHDRHHVLAVASQRLAIDLVLTSSEVNELADRGIAQHMWLLTGFSLQP